MCLCHHEPQLFMWLVKKVDPIHEVENGWWIRSKHNSETRKSSCACSYVSLRGKMYWSEWIDSITYCVCMNKRERWTTCCCDLNALCCDGACIFEYSESRCIRSASYFSAFAFRFDVCLCMYEMKFLLTRNKMWGGFDDCISCCAINSMLMLVSHFLNKEKKKRTKCVN